MKDDELFAVQRKSISKMKEKLHYHQMLYKLTKHSKKKQKHLENIKVMQEVILSAYEEYGWH